jgi:signal transduction histidine kinase
MDARKVEAGARRRFRRPLKGEAIERLRRLRPARPQRIPLAAKYVALFFLLVSGLLITTGVVQAYFSYRDNKDSLTRIRRQQAQALADSIDQVVSGSVAQLRAVRDPSLTLKQRQLLFDSLRSAERFGDIYYVDGKGRERLRAAGDVRERLRAGGDVESGRDLSRLPGFRKAKAELEYYSAPYRADTDPLRPAGHELGRPVAPVMQIAFAEIPPGKGVVIGVFRVDSLQTLIDSTDVGKAGYAYVTDSAGQPIAHPDHSVFYRSSREKLAALPQVHQALGEETGDTIGRDRSGRKVLSAYATVTVGQGDQKWHAFVDQPESEAFASARASINRIILLLGIFLAAAIAASFLLAGRLVRPIKAMQVAARRIGAGEYDQRIDLTRSDELGALADEFNRMAGSLEESYGALEQKVEDRTRELQEALSQLADKSRELEVASRHKSEFLANMSHEVRTPLNAILGFSQVLQERLFGELNEKQLEYLDDILSSANHLLALINDILDLSKVEAGQLELEIAEFSLREALERGVVMVRERAVKNGVALDLTTDPRAETVEADERRVRQVIYNLLSNAVKFTPSGGRIDVSTERVDGEVRVAVQDTGPGIGPEDRERIFEEFQQALGAKSQAEGTGLGLALSRRFVEVHGGRIWVESDVGTGSTFLFTLPVRHEVAAE